MQHPVFFNRFNTYLHFGLWTVILAVHLLLVASTIEIPFQLVLLDGFVSYFVLSFLSLSVFYATRFNRIENTSLINVIINHISSAALLVFVWQVISKNIVDLIWLGNFNYNEFYFNSLFWRAISGLAFYSIAAMVYYFKQYYDSFKEQELQESQLRTLVREAELNALKLQINPHFLFNSLNSVSSLTISDSEKAREMVVKLSEYLRYSLSKTQSQFSTFSEEISNMLLYLEIEKVRFGEKLQIVQEISENCKNKQIPNLLLQPLLENAIKHGVYESTETVYIKLLADCNQSYLKLTIENDFDSETPPRKGAGVGLKNVKNRLNLIYKQSDLISIKKTENKFTVVLIIPQNQE
ncbi:MAG: histidine kinase [Bacteroidales bacterium]|nr:histidine kinase [Bacteroidales bacterium]